jgi:hypothetical protein
VKPAVGAALVALLLALGPAASAAEHEVSAAELRELAAAAIDDPRALDDLRSVERVDGQTVDLAGALDVEGEVLASRLAQLASRAAPAGDERVARAVAKEILDGPDFRGRRSPRPLHGILTWIGKRLEPLGRPFTWVSGLSGPGLALLGGVVVALAALAATYVIVRRADAVEADTRRRRTLERSDDPDELLRAAEDAEATGELELALRLRFRAGLLHLDRQGALVFRPSLTTGEVRRRVRNPLLETLTRTMDEVVYGRRPASVNDVAEARAAWPRVLHEVDA